MKVNAKLQSLSWHQAHVASQEKQHCCQSATDAGVGTQQQSIRMAAKAHLPLFLRAGAKPVQQGAAGSTG